MPQWVSFYENEIKKVYFFYFSTTFSMLFTFLAVSYWSIILYQSFFFFFWSPLMVGRLKQQQIVVLKKKNLYCFSINHGKTKCLEAKTLLKPTSCCFKFFSLKAFDRKGRVCKIKDAVTKHSHFKIFQIRYKIIKE